ncbi:MAG: HEAT repeat domain-containing protein [Methanoregulaceae archaeon]|nr:HEAT repeat domain-containing protein [Methanoregulaceae archaeon]
MKGVCIFRVMSYRIVPSKKGLGVRLTSKKPEFLELTRGNISVTGGYENQSSSLTFLHTSSRDELANFQKNPELLKSYENTSDFDALILMLGHEKSEVRIAAAGALGTLGDPRAIEPLFRTCMDENISVKAAARDALASIVARMH